MMTVHNKKMMQNFFLRRAVKVAVLVLVAVVLVVYGAIANAAEPKLDDNWHFTLIPYVWVPGVTGKMNISPPQSFSSSLSSSSGDIDISSGSYLKNLTFAAMLSMELEKGRWSLLSDIVYINFNNDNRTANFPNLPGGALQIKGETGLKAWAVEVAPAYSLYRTESTKFDLLAGVRYIGIDSKVTLDLSPPLPAAFPSHTFSYKPNLVDPIVGVKGKFELGKGWFVPYYFDAGGFGINDEWSWQAFGGLGYHFSDLFSMVLSYRHLQYNFDNNKLVKDFSLSGTQLGFVFRF